MFQKKGALIIEDDKTHSDELIQVLQDLGIDSIHVATHLQRAKELLLDALTGCDLGIVILDGEFPSSGDLGPLERAQEVARDKYGNSRAFWQYLQEKLVEISVEHILVLSNSSSLEYNQGFSKQVNYSGIGDDKILHPYTCFAADKDIDKVGSFVSSMETLLSTSKRKKSG
ncbi:hypothetical protein MK079_01950 [Candidatus Gracilibacteria bacterium]|nr:hypothetical protein [Candidatus Gracilibacteria bacterium]